MLTPYQFASNTPIQAINLDGLERAYWAMEAFRWMAGQPLQTIETGETVVDEAIVKPAKAVANMTSTAYERFEYVYGTKVPQALGFEMEDAGIGDVLTTEGVAAFGGEVHQKVLKELANTVKDEVIYGGVVGHIGGKGVKALSKSLPEGVEFFGKSTPESPCSGDLNMGWFKKRERNWEGGSSYRYDYDVNQAIPVLKLPNGKLVSAGGHHRVAAMKSLGEETILSRIVEWNSLSEGTRQRHLNAHYGTTSQKYLDE